MTKKRTTVITIETDEVVIRRFSAASQTAASQTKVKGGPGSETSIDTTCEVSESTPAKPNQEISK